MFRRHPPLCGVQHPIFLTYLDNTVVSVGLASVQSSLHAGVTSLQRMVDGYADLRQPQRLWCTAGTWPPPPVNRSRCLSRPGGVSRPRGGVRAERTGPPGRGVLRTRSAVRRVVGLRFRFSIRSWPSPGARRGSGASSGDALRRDGDPGVGQAWTEVVEREDFLGKEDAGSSGAVRFDQCLAEENCDLSGGTEVALAAHGARSHQLAVPA
jgi:hypothetical protein